MRRFSSRTTVAALLFFAGYSVFVVIRAASSGKGHGSVFWVSIGLIFALAAAALWAAWRLLLLRKANRETKPS